MQHGHSHGSLTWICSLDTKMQNGHRHGHAAWTRTWARGMDCRMDTDIDMQHRHGHTTWTWTCSWTRTCSMDLDTQHGLSHAAWTCSCSMDLDNGHGTNGYRNGDNEFSPPMLVFRQFTLNHLIRHRHSASWSAPLITDQSAKAQLCLCALQPSPSPRATVSGFKKKELASRWQRLRCDAIEEVLLWQARDLWHSLQVTLLNIQALSIFLQNHSPPPNLQRVQDLQCTVEMCSVFIILTHIFLYQSVTLIF